MLINSEGPLLCNKASVMELIEKPLVEHTDNSSTVVIVLKKVVRSQAGSPYIHVPLRFHVHSATRSRGRFLSLHYSRRLLHSAKANYWAVGLSRK